MGHRGSVRPHSQRTGLILSGLRRRENRELRRSTALWDRRLLFLDAMSAFDDFSLVYTSLKKRTLEHRLRYDLGW